MKIVDSLVRLEPFGPYEDPDAAPGSRACDEPAPRWSLRRGIQNSLGIYLFGLVFMVFGVLSVFADDPSPVEIMVGEFMILVLSAMYAGAPWVSDSSLRVRWVYLGLFTAVMFSTASVLGNGFSTFGVYVGVLMATLIPWRIARLLIGLWGLGLGLYGLLAAAWQPSVIGVIAVGIGWAVGSGIEQGRVGEKLRRAERRASELAVVAERERIARDLHDILGHSLTAVSIKSGLAAKLVDADPVAARAEMAEVERIARQALADVRSTASGMREVRLATEIASARAVLESAGVAAETPSAVEPADEQAGELLGYAVRESVTNVIRHSRASRCVISAGPDWVQISDDGRGFGQDRTRQGSGMQGLRDRIETAGGSITWASGPTGTSVSVALSGSPRPASTAPVGSASPLAARAAIGTVQETSPVSGGTS